MSALNKAISQQLIVEAWGAGQFAVLDRYVAPTEAPQAATAAQLSGPAWVKQQIIHWRSLFRDLQVTVVEQIAEGDQVMTHWQVAGTQQQTGAGSASACARVYWSNVTLHRFAGGKIVEAVTFTQVDALVAQLTALTASWQQHL